MVQWFRVNLFRENQIVGVVSRSGQTCQPQKGKKYERLKPRARKSSDNWVKSRQMSKISQWKDIFWNWAGYLLIHLHLTWKQTLRFQHFFIVWLFEKVWEISCQLARAWDTSWNHETHDKVVRLGKSEWKNQTNHSLWEWVPWLVCCSDHTMHLRPSRIWFLLVVRMY